MSDLVTKPGSQGQQEQKVETRTAPERITGYTAFAMAVAVLAVLGAVAHAQDKYSLKSPSGIAFSDFQGYEDWSVVSSARTDEILKVIVANPATITAYKAGTPVNGQTFPDGSMIVKLQWKLKKSTEAPFAVEVPDVFAQAFVMEKDSKRFPKSGGWGYAVFNYDAPSDKFSADPKSLSDCGNACHTAVKAKDYIFHPYQKRRTRPSHDISYPLRQVVTWPPKTSNLQLGLKRQLNAGYQINCIAVSGAIAIC